MKAVDISIQNRTAILALTVVLILAGISSYINIPKESNPQIDIPIFIITTIYPGIAPGDMESLVTQPLERELQGINGIDEIRSTTIESVSIIVVEFDLAVSNLEASQQIRERVDLAKSELPSEAEEPMINEVDLDDFPIMSVNLAADFSLDRLTQIAERLQDDLETVSGVREVDLVGGLEREVQVNVDLAKMQGYNVSFNQMIGAIQGQNVTIPGGTVPIDRFNYLIRVSGEFTDPTQISDLVVATPNISGPDSPRGPAIYMRDLADVIFGFKDRESYARLRAYQMEEDGGKLQEIEIDDVSTTQVVTLNIKQRPGGNILETADALNAALEAYPFPAGTQVLITGDASEDVRVLIKDLENSIISGMLFVVLVLVFFLGLRNALLVGTAVPLSILVGFIVFTVLGYTVNFIILFSLIIALGLLVDNSIVIVENIYRYREMGYGRFEAAREGTAEVGYALVASTATLVGAFAPMLFWPGIIGQFMGYLPLTLIIVLLCSLFVALIIYPVLTAYFVKLDHEHNQAKGVWGKRIGYGLLIFTGLVIGLANPIMLTVLVLASLFFGISYKFFIKPLADRFTTSTLPNFIERYKGFLQTMLARDYTAKAALFRNTFGLGSLTLGALIAILGALLGNVSDLASTVVLGLGVVLLAIGALAVLVHTFESIFLGGRKSVIIGLLLAVVMGSIMGFISMGDRGLEGGEILRLMSLPVSIIVIGFLGSFRKSSKNLILTDNRAKLVSTTLGSLFGIVVMFVIAPTGVQFFPETDPSRIDINIKGPIGMNVETSNEIVYTIQERLDELFRDNPNTKSNVENVLFNVGIPGGGDFGGGVASAENSRVSVYLVDYGDRTESSAISMDKIRNKVQGIPDVTIQVEGQQQGPPTGPPVNIEISGDDFSQVVRISRDIRQLLQEASGTGAIPGLVDVSDNVSGGTPEYRVNIDHVKASQLGLPLSEIAQTIRIAMNGLETSTYRDGEDEYDIILRLKEEDRKDLDAIKNLTINSQGTQIPLVAVADFEEAAGFGSITRLNLNRTAVVQGFGAAGFSGPEILSQVQDYLAEYQETVPFGYTIKYTGESEDQEESFGFLTTALLLGFALIFLVMLFKFNSFLVPLIILVAVGLSLIGVMLGLILTRTPFSLMTFVGIISLAGIVCINNIVLVEYINQLLDKGKSKMEAIVDAGAIRLRPVLLTALTTILGLVPLTFGINIDFVGLLTSFDPAFQIGSDNTLFWGPLGTAIISGLLFATFLTLVIVPVLYSVFDSLAHRLTRLFE